MKKLTIIEKANRIASNKKAEKYATALYMSKRYTFNEVTEITYNKFFEKGDK